jgi:Secretion system C-terminal sorting domain
MTGAVNIYNGEPIPLDSIEFVIVTGSAPFLGIYNSPPWPPYPCGCIDDTAAGYIKALTHTVGNIWSYHTIIPIGQPCGIIGYKFGVIYPGYDTINGGSGSLMNELPFSVNHNLLLTGLQPIIVINDLFGHPLPPDNVEQIENLIPDRFILEQNYPNPFNPTTKIRYNIPEFTNVVFKVFNMLGEEIETLVNSEQSAGVYEATFDASNLSSGIYFYTLKTESFSSSKKMILIK